MARKSNPAVTGGFVLGAIALLVIAVIVFGGGELFAAKRYLVTYFPGSVKGLRVGSDVLFRGVRVGYVTGIEVVTDPDVERFNIPVTFQILPDSFTVKSADGEMRRLSASESRKNIDDLVKQGLRTKLETESFVTGQLIIQLDFYPDHEPTFHSGPTPYQEIPSVPSDIQQYMQQLQKLAAEINRKVDAEKLIADIQGILSGLNKLANSPDLINGLAALNRLASSAEMQALPGDLGGAARAVSGAMAETQQLASKLDQDIDPLVSDTRKALISLNAVLENSLGVLEEVELQMGQEGAARLELNSTLTEVQQAARSLRVLTDYLALHPEALLRGKPQQKE